MKEANINEFIGIFRQSLDNETFVKLTLANYKGLSDNPQRILARPLQTKKGSRLFVQYKFETGDIVKNYTFDESVEIIDDKLKDGFRNAHLFTTENDFQLEIGKKASRLKKAKATFAAPLSNVHDRVKNDLIDNHAYYLKALGITTDSGEIRSKQRDKWKQINKFVEVLAGEIEKADIDRSKPLCIVDMGSGKGYLTFAAYDYLNNTLGIKTEITGIEMRNNIVDLCNSIARSGGFDGLRFETGSIAELGDRKMDVLIALHACDTATDDALYQGITANARVIIAAPCCHKEVKKQMRPPALLSGILKHSVMLERTAETITDGVRSMLLEACGYKTKLFEFVATEHTPKNNLLVASRSSDTTVFDVGKSSNVTEVLKEYHIENQRFADLLSGTLTLD